MHNIVIGIGIGLMIAGTVLKVFPYISPDVALAIAACEKDLPRNQHCKIVAVPE